MADGDDNDLPQRVAKLESQVEELREELRRLRETMAGGESETSPASGRERSGRTEDRAAGARDRSETTRRPSEPAAANSSPGSASEPSASNDNRTGTGWLNYLGIGLLLVGVGFLFQYAVDRGWLSEAVRVSLVAGLGTVLLASGVRLESERPRLASVLLGGASATFYSTVFAAFQLYELIPYPVAFGSMIAVTGGTFALSMHEDDVVLAQIGALGAYGTPFMLYSGEGGVPGLVTYTCIATAGVTAIYLYRDWRSLLATAFVGQWLVLGIARIHIGSNASLAARGSVQVGALVGWMLTGAVPVAARLLGRTHVEGESDGIGAWVGPVAVAVTPLVVASISRTLWEFPGAVWAAAALVGSGGYAGLYQSLRARGRRQLAFVVPWVVACGMAWSLFEVTGGPLRTLGLAMETFLLVEVSRRRPEKSISAAAAIVGATTLLFIIDQSVFDPRPAVASAVLGAALAVVFGAFRRCESSGIRVAMHYAIHVVALCWIFGTFGALSNGQAWVSALWAALGVAVTLAGMKFDSSHAHFTGLATVGLVVAKLFLVDLAELDPFWRIVLFVGLGGGFLIASYLAPGLLKLEGTHEA